jgi:ribA/ribD-fused uncharacterized protein
MGEYKNYSSYFFLEKCMFGGFPTQSQVDELTSMGVNMFVDLTVPGEVDIYTIPENCIYVNYPISDRQVPSNIPLFAALILRTYDFIQNENSKVYIHCKGGHGRSGILVACLLYLLNPGISTEKAIILTTEAHSRRLVMREKWRKMGSPQTYFQKKFVHKMFTNLFFFKAYRTGTTVGFSNYSFHDITVDNHPNPFLPNGVFPTSEALFQASKNPNDSSYVQRQIQSKNPKVSKNIAQRITITDEWNQNKKEIMKDIIRLKFDQHSHIRETLVRTGLRKIVFNSRRDDFFGIGHEQNGENVLGKILQELREEYQRLLLV